MRRIGGDTFDVVVHLNAGFTLCEFEQREVDADTLVSFSQKAYQSTVTGARWPTFRAPGTVSFEVRLPLSQAEAP